MGRQAWIILVLVWQLSLSSGEKPRQSYGPESGLALKRPRPPPPPPPAPPPGGRGGGRIGKSFKFPATENVEDLVGFYEPSFLAQVWPKLRNGMHLSMGNACWHDVTLLMKDLLHGRAWAYSMVDSSGRYEPGLLGGNRFWIGSKEQCYKMDERFRASSDNNTLAELRHGDYLSTVQRQQNLYGNEETWQSLMSQDELLQQIVSVDNTPPYRLAFSAVLAHLNITKVTLHKSHQIILGVCLPMVCTAADIHELLDFSILINDHLKSNIVLPRSVKIIRVRPLDFDYNMADDSAAMILLLFAILLVLLVIFATMIDLNLIHFVSYGSRSFDIEQPVNRSVMESSAIAKKTIDNVPSDKINKHLQIHTSLARMKPQPMGPSNIRLVMPRKFPENMSIVDMDTVTIDNTKTKINQNLMTAKKVVRGDTRPPSLTLDVVSVDDESSCRRCGRYRKQCRGSKSSDGSTPSACAKVNYESYEVVVAEKKRVEVERFDWSAMSRSLLLSFSLNLNLKKIFNTNGQAHSLNAVHGLKVISMMWIIYIHVALVYSYLADNGGDIGKDSSIYRTLASGTYSFDTLFLISGLLSAHHYFCLKNRYSTKELVNFSGVVGQLMQFICFVTNRAVRLLPPYVFVIFVSAAAARRQRAVSAHALPERDHAACDTYWWRNVLYVNTFYSSRDRCMQWSWYVSEDTQLHVLGVLLLCATCARARPAAALAAAATLAACAADSLLRTARRQSDGVYGLYEELLNRPWTRLGPYLVGVLTGWLLYHVDCKLRVCRIQTALLWTACVAVMAAVGSDLLGAELGRYGRVVYAPLAHTLWSLAVAWIIIACVTDYGGVLSTVLSHKWLFPLSRLSYCVYLVHPLVIRAVLLSADITTHMDSGLMIVSYLGLTVLSLLAGLALSLLLETPFSCLMRRALHCDTNAT